MVRLACTLLRLCKTEPMDEQLPKLPKYVFTRPNGSFRYKRNVPKDLRKIIGKKTVYRKLGDTYEDAIRRLPLVHAEIEALFDRERRTPASERARAIVKERIGGWQADAFAQRAVDVEWDIFEDFQELAEDLETKVPDEVIAQIRSATMKPEPFSLERSLEEYYAFKVAESGEDRGLRNRINRITKDLILCLGREKFSNSELEEIKRADANSYRDFLLKQMAPNSVVRNVGVIKAAVNFAILENDLEAKNVFNGLRVSGAGSGRTDRLPMEDKDLKLLLEHCQSSKVAQWLILLLTDTGARLGEIVGLQRKDVDLENRTISIRQNSIRSLKTKSSERCIPLSPRVHSLLSQSIAGIEPDEPVFPKYARDRGNDAASAMLMKHVRSITDDKRVTVHSLRHRMKDKLRNSNCPEHLSMAILGHSSNSIAANYGAGYAMEVMREALEKVWET